MTGAMDLSARIGHLRQRFLVMYWARHDELEVLLDKSRHAEHTRDALAAAEAMLHKVAGSAGSIGLKELGEAAGIVENYIREQLAIPGADLTPVRNALNAYLDVSMDVCNPTERLLDVG